MVRLLWLIIGVLFSVGSASALQVTVHPAVVVRGEQVRLGDVAELVPSSHRLSGKRVARAPAPGNSIKIDRNQIHRVLTQNGVVDSELKLSGASAVDVKRDSLVITAARIQQDIDAYLSRLQQQHPDATFKFTPQGRINNIILPAGKLQVEVIPAVKRVVGSRRFTLIYRVDGRTVKNQSVSGKLELLAPVVVAQRNLKRNSIVDYDDVSMATLDISKIDQPVFAIADVVGKKVVRSTRSGQIVEEQNLDLPPLVKKGAFVKLIARRGSMVLTATGVARQDGKMAQIISVRNSSSQKEVLAKVIGPDRVEVGF